MKSARNVGSDFASGFFFLCFSLFVLWESMRLGLGDWQTPGPGFFSFNAGMLLIGFSLNLIRKGWRIQESPKVYSSRVVVALVSTIAYSLVLEPLGFLVSTFFLLGIFFHLGKPRRWWSLVGISGFVTLLMYLAFGILLQVPLPRGFLRI